MPKRSPDNIIVTIDVGTTKICVFVAHHLHGQQTEIIGIGKVPSDGLEKGVVVDIGRTIHSIKTAVQEAELMAGITIESASVGISGAHISARNSIGMTQIARGQITATDIQNALSSAQAILIPEGEQILHTLPQYFLIDGKEKVQDPLGMHGVRLEVYTHIICGGISSVQNLVTCCQKAGVAVTDIILEQLASADAVLSPDERMLGVGILDIGGGTSDLAIYQHGNIRHTLVLPVAGNHFTKDIAIGLRTTLDDAERIKCAAGTLVRNQATEQELLTVKAVDGENKTVVLKKMLTDIIEPRAQELLSLVHEEIITKNLQHTIPAGLVITGGGSLLHGIADTTEQIFSLPVRIGHPRVEFDLPESLDSPIYATGYGLIIHTLKKRQNTLQKQSDAPLAERIMQRMKTWISDFF